MTNQFKDLLFFGAAVGALGWASVAAAQAGDAPAGASATGLEEVVVTATRQTDTVNRVPLSVTAQTQRTMDQQGVRVLADLVGSAPALTLTAQQNPAVANIAIRGISDLGLGAATTGFYLDDTAIQKRNVGGAANGSGTPLPPLFDLDRVEVLRGPQGTLFGGSSEGGTIRYITPTPSLTRYSAYVRAEASQFKYGSESYELGVAVGGPIIQDKLAFRASLWGRHTGGWVDYIDRIRLTTFAKDANDEDAKLGRFSLLWAPTDRMRVTLAYLNSRDHYDSAFNGYTRPITNQIVARDVCFNTAGITPQRPSANPAIIPCAVNGAPNPAVTYRRPGFTYGPWPDLGPGKSMNQDLQPSTVMVSIPSLTLEYNFDKMSVKSITSYIWDYNKQVGLENLAIVRDANVDMQYGALTIGRQFTSIGQLPDLRKNNGHFYTRNKRQGLTQEVRFSSSGDARPLSWVAGVYYSNLRTTQRYDNGYEELEQIGQFLYGLSTEQRYGVGVYPLFEGHGIDAKRQRLQDIEMAAFGELNYWVTDKLKLTAGVRISRVQFNYTELHYGPISGFNLPTVANGGGPNFGTVTEAPVAPKVAAQYQVTSNDMVYVSASKGFRAGGVNSNLPEFVCAPGFAQYGLTTAALPLTYQSDTVWNYEGGAKVRVLNNKLQINGSVYRIDWKNPQLAIGVGLACPAFTGNAGAARSQGFELEAQARLFAGLSGNLAVGYTDAEYTQNAVALNGGVPPLYAAFKGQKLAIPPLTVQVGARYDMAVSTKVRAYARADWRFIKAIRDTLPQTFSFGGITNNNYAPDNVYQDTQRTNIRLGVEYGDLDINLFVNNLFNSQKGTTIGGRGSCRSVAAGGTAACANYVTLQPFLTTTPDTQPRQIGIQLAYRR